MSQLANSCSGDGDPTRISRVQHRANLAATLRSIGLEPYRPVLVVVGGAGGMSDAELDRLRPLFTEGLAPLAQEHAAVVVDGGTDAGVMRLMGEARTRLSATFTLAGVAPAAKALIPGDAESIGRTHLAHDHSHFVLVSAETWAAGAPWLAWVATEIAGDERSVTVLVNGGDVSWADVESSIAAHRPVVAVAGTGRVADQLAAALTGEASDDRARELAASGLVAVADFAEGPGEVANVIGRYLLKPHPATSASETGRAR